jgi:hypothetical protein
MGPKAPRSTGLTDNSIQFADLAKNRDGPTVM